MCFYHQYNLVVDPPSCVCIQFTLLWTGKHNISGDKDGTMPSLGKIEEFHSASTNINRYLERLEQYFIANGVPADTGEWFKSRATLISVVGSKAYNVLSDLCSPEAPLEKTYDDLATILKDYFAPKKLLITERYRFHNCIQLEIAVDNTALARDHLSGQKWQPGTVVQHPPSHSCRVHLDDGRVWGRHVDDILQNNSHSKQLNSVYHPWRQQPQLFLTLNQLPHLKPAHIHLIAQLNWRQLLPPQVQCCVDHPALTDLLRDWLRKCDLEHYQWTSAIVVTIDWLFFFGLWTQWVLSSRNTQMETC